MPEANCFKIHGRPDLQKKFDDALKEGISAKELARKIILEEHGRLHDEMEGLKKQVIKNYKPESYSPPDNSADVEKIKSDYETKINQAKTENDALQKSSASSILQHPQEATGEPGSERERMESSQQGNEPPGTQIPGEKNKGAGEEKPPISEPPKGSRVFVEHPATELSHRGLQNVANEFSLPDVQTRDRKSDIQLRQDAINTANDWAEKGVYTKNVEGLVSKAEKGEILTDEQRVILERHLANLSHELRDIAKNSPEFNDKLAEIKRLKLAGEKTRSEAGAALRIPGGGSRSNPITDYADALVAKMEANGVDALTEAQKSEVEKQVKLYEEKTKMAEDKVKMMEEKMAEMEAGKEVKNISSKSKKATGKKKTSDDYKKERQSFVEELKAARKEHEDYLKNQGIHTAGFVSFTGKELKAVGKIIRSHVEEIGDNLAEVTKKVFNDVKDYFEGITEKDVHDIIAGVYNEQQKTKSQLAADLHSLNIEAKLINQLESLLKGGEPKGERAKIDRNHRIKDLREKIKSYKLEEKEANRFYGEKNIEEEKEYKEAGKFYTETKEPDFKQLEAIKKRNEERTKEIKENISKGNFQFKAKPTSIFDNSELQKKYPKLYNQTLDAIKAKEDAQHDFDLSLLKDQEAKRNWWARRGQNLKGFIATTKALKSGIDDSGVAVQNIVAMIAHPRSGAKAFLTHLSHFASQAKFDRFVTAIHNNKPLWDLMQKSGLQFTEPSSLKQAQREEAFSNNLLDKSFKIQGKEYNIGKYTTKPFERLFTTIGNAMRVNMFSRITQRWMEEGRTFETHPEDYKSLATLLNTETGRGKLHENVERASELITAGIWSPRLMASRLNLLGLSDLSSPLTGKGFYAGLSPRIRKMAAGDVSKFIGTGIALMGLASFMGAKTDFNPESSIFGTVTIGNYTISVFDGFNKYVKTIVQGISGHKIKNGVRSEENRGTTIGRFFRGSTTPAVGVGIDLLIGKTYMGKPVTPGGEAVNLAVPMSETGLEEPLKRDGAIGLLPGLGSFFGLNISDERDFQNTTPSTKSTHQQRPHKQVKTHQ